MKSLVFDFVMYAILSITIGVWVYFLSHTSLFSNFLASVLEEDENIKTSEVTLSLLITPSDELEKVVVNNNKDINSRESENINIKEGALESGQEPEELLGVENKIEEGVSHEVSPVPVVINNHIGKQDLSGSIFGIESLHDSSPKDSVKLIQTGAK